MRFFILIISLTSLLSSCKKEYNLKGHVYSSLTERPIKNAHIHFAKNILASTNEYGEFNINLKSNRIKNLNTIELQFSALGFHNIKQEIKLKDSLNLEIQLVHNFDHSDIRSEIMDTVNAISKNDFISSGVTGIAGRRPKQFDQRYWLMKHATNQELIQLSKFPHPTIRVTAFHGLYIKKDNQITEVMKHLATDKTRIHYVMGCVGNSIPVNEFCFTRILRYQLSESDLPLPLPFPSDPIKFSPYLEKKIRETIIATNKFPKPS